MNISGFSQLINTDFDLKNVTVTPYTFPAGNRIENKRGRKNNILHIVTFGTRYYNVQGKETTVCEGEIIFIPKGTSYCTFNKDTCRGIGVCFDMIGSEEILLPPGVYTDFIADKKKIGNAILRMEELYTSSPSQILSLKSILFAILHNLAKTDTSLSKEYALIKPALDLISNSFCVNMPVLQYAKACNISESYFRRVFIKCIGMSPIDYRNELRFALSQKLYREGKTLAEIAEITGFFDAGYFSKVYKKRMGTSLKNGTDII